jgi:hypothetical protein
VGLKAGGEEAVVKIQIEGRFLVFSICFADIKFDYLELPRTARAPHATPSARGARAGRSGNRNFDSVAFISNKSRVIQNTVFLDELAQSA